MAPINLPDGTEVSEVILPDGATASEVIAPDGSTVFRGIPDSVVLQYFATEYSQGDSTWPDDTETAAMSITGDPQDATLSDGSESLNFNGTDDEGLVTLPESLEGGDLNAFAVEFAFETSLADNDFDVVFGLVNDSGQGFRSFFNNDEDGNADGGNADFLLEDPTGNRFRFSFSTNPNLNDGSRHDLTIVIDDASNNNATLILDGSEETVAVGTAGSPSNFEAWDYDMGHAARNNQGSTDRHSDIEIGAIRWHDEAISNQTIDDYSG